MSPSNDQQIAPSIGRGARRLLVAVAVALVASGCVRVQTGPSTASHAGVGAPLRHASTHCLDLGNLVPDDADACTQAVPIGDVETVEQGLIIGGAATYPGVQREYQYLLAYLVSDVLEAPPTLQTSAGEPLTFHLASSYADALEAISASGDGRRWVGYVADPIDTRRFAGFALDADFIAPAAAGGSTVVSGAFHGLRLIGTGTPTDPMHLPPPALVMDPDAPVTCDGAAPDPAATEPAFSTCSVELALNAMLFAIDPAAADPTTADFDDLTELANVPVASTRLFDARVTGVDVDVVAGSAATASFTVSGTAPDGASQDLQVSATSTVPGAAATTDRATVQIADASSSSVAARIDVPAATPAGTYAVTLRLSAGSTAVREATVALRVAAAPATPEQDQEEKEKDVTAPSLTRLSASTRTDRASLAGQGLRVRVRHSEPSDVVVELSRRTRDARWNRLVRRAATLDAPQATTFTLKPTNRTMRTLGMRATRLLRIRITLTDRAGNVAVVHRFVRID